MKKTIASRGLALVNERSSCYPIFVGDPHTVICTTLTKETKTLNKKIQTEMKSELDSHISKLSYFSRRKAKKYLKKYWNYNFFDFVKDEEITAFNPDVPLLNFILQFCIKFNCLDVFYRCLGIVDTVIFTETPNCKVNSDVLYAILYSKDKSKLRFTWMAGEAAWSVNLKEK